jgi:hypothetical protein
MPREWGGAPGARRIRRRDPALRPAAEAHLLGTSIARRRRICRRPSAGSRSLAEAAARATPHRSPPGKGQACAPSTPPAHTKDRTPAGRAASRRPAAHRHGRHMHLPVRRRPRCQFILQQRPAPTRTAQANPALWRMSRWGSAQGQGRSQIQILCSPASPGPRLSRPLRLTASHRPAWARHSLISPRPNATLARATFIVYAVVHAIIMNAVVNALPLYTVTTLGIPTAPFV